MRRNLWVRALDFLIESSWLLAIVMVPIFFDTMTVRIFEPDKIVIFRNIVLVMVIAVLVRAVVVAPAAMARRGVASEAEDKRPWWRREAARRPLLIPVIVFLVVYAAATVNSVLPGISFWGSYDRMQGFYTWLSYITFFAIMAYLLRAWSQIERIVSAMVFASVPVAVYGIMQHLQLDPVQWGADTSTRVASTLGNAIFVGAYLIMCMPLTIYRLWMAVDRMRPPESVVEPEPVRAQTRRTRPAPKDTITIEFTGLPPIVSVIGYGITLMLSFATLYFSGSRGPYYGFIVAILVMGFLLTYRLAVPWPAIAGLVGAAILYVFLDVVNALDVAVAFIFLILFLIVAIGVLAAPRSLKLPSPRLIAGAAFVLAILVFPQAVNVISAAPASSSAQDTAHLTDLAINGSSEVRVFIWKGSVGLIKERPLLGWGPETMIYVYSKYYLSGLGHIERANAAPDRNHDEWLDFLVFSGVIGLAAWLAILGVAAWIGIRVLRRARSMRAVILTAAIAASVVGHLAEATVGIDIVSTLMLLWMLFAMVTVLYARPELLSAPAVRAIPGMEPRPALVGIGIGVDMPAMVASGAASAREARAGSQRARPRGPNGRTARGPAVTGPPSVSLDRLSGAQQGGLVGLIVLTLAAFVVGSLLFVNNVQVVRADNLYKMAQGNDGVGSDCLSHAANPQYVGLCQIGSQYTQRQAADYAGVTLVPTAIAQLQEAIGEQPNQDMYYLWLGKAYLDEARYHELIGGSAEAVPWFQKARDILISARALNPRNADHPMNLARMFAGWAQLDPTKWPLADQYFHIATALAVHNGRWWDEWGATDLRQVDQRSGLTAPQRTALYHQALAAFQHAASVDDLLGDARVYTGQAYERLGRFDQAARSYADALRVGGFEIFDAPPYAALPQVPAGAPTPPAPSVVQFLVSALSTAHDYTALVRPTNQLLPSGASGQEPAYLGESPMTLAYSPTLGLTTSSFAQTLQAISTTLRQKGLSP